MKKTMKKTPNAQRPTSNAERGKPQFYPGPWTISKDDGTAAEAARPNVIIENEEAHIAFCFDDGLSIPSARLIAAAPDLFEALEDIIKQFEKSKLMVGADLADSIRIFGKNAIAKALGGSR